MKKFRYISVLTLGLFLNSLCGQNNIGSNVDTDLDNIAGDYRVYAVGAFDNRDKSYDGSPLLFENGMESKVRFSGRTDFTDKSYQMNYNIVSQELLIENSESIVTFPSSIVDRMVVTDKGEIVDYCFLEGNVYRIILENQGLRLLKNHEVKLIKANYNAALDAGNIKDKYVLKSDFWILLDDQLYKLPSNRRKLKKVPNEIRSVCNYLHAKKVDLGDEVLLKSALINYLNKNLN